MFQFKVLLVGSGGLFPRIETLPYLRTHQYIVGRVRVRGVVHEAEYSANGLESLLEKERKERKEEGCNSYSGLGV